MIKENKQKIVFGLIFGLRSILSKGNEEIILENNPTIKAYVEQCLEEIALDAIYTLGNKGGYIYEVGDIAYDQEYLIAYHYYEGEDTTPTKADMADHISFYIKENLNSCLDNLSAFKEMNMEIETEEMKAETIVGIEDVTVSLDYPITIIRQNKKSIVREYIVTIPIRLGHLHSIIKAIAAKEIEDPEWIDLEYLTTFDVDINVRFLGQHRVLYEMTDIDSSIETRGPYVFNTLAKFEE